MKFNVVSAVVAIASMVAFNQAAAETIGDALAKCSQTSNSLQRLVCYDRVVKDMNQYAGLEDAMTRTPAVPRAPQTAPGQVVMTPASPAAQAVEFGFENRRESSSDPDLLNGTIVSLAKNPYGKYAVSLQDGTVWQQTDSTSMRLDTGMSVIVERGVLGAFYLRVDGINKKMKVKRKQ